VMRISAHDVPEDRMVPYRHHWLWTEFGFLAQPRAKPAAKYKDRNF
jgi:hypothetical protein